MKTKMEIANYDNAIQTLRTQINVLDEQIVNLLKGRLQLVFQAREIKRIDQIPKHSLEREQVVLDNATYGTTGLEQDYLKEIYQVILATTRKIADQK